MFKNNFILALLFLNGSVALSSDFHSPRTVALGGAGHAGPMLNDAIYLNPSFTSFLPAYSLGVNYFFAPDALDSPARGVTVFGARNFNFSIQDGRSELFQAGVGYTQYKDNRLLHIGASKAVVKQLGVGIGAKFVFPNDYSRSQFEDGIFSTSLIASDWLHIVGVVDNIFENEKAKAQGFFRELLIGAKVNVKGIVMAYLDPHVTPALRGSEKVGYEAGLESTPFRDFFVRAGMFRNAVVPFEGLRGRGYGAGVGWIAPRISLDYGFSHIMEPLAAIVHVVGATVYF